MQNQPNDLGPLFTKGDRGVAETAIKNILQVTSYDFDARFYQRTLPAGTAIEWAPSVTHALGVAWPASFGLTQWIGDVGNQRADEIKTEAAEDGTFVHDRIAQLLDGGIVTTLEEINELFRGPRALKIKRCFQAFLDWYEANWPETINVERVTWLEDPLCAGTVDYQCMINGESWTIDWKTSKSIHDTHRAQVALYQKSEGTDNAAILHLGNQTKKRYSFLPVDPDRWLPLAEDAIRTYHKHNPNARPTDEIFPEEFALPVKEETT